MKIGLVLFPAPGSGHMIPTVELAKRLVQHNFSITILTMHLPTISSSSSSYIESVSASGLDITFVELPPIDLPFDGTENRINFLSLLIEKHKPHVLNAITQLQSSTPSIHIAALVMDLFTMNMIDVAEELSIPSYLYFTSGAVILALMLYIPTLDEKVRGKYKDLEGEIEIPGLPPLPPLVLPDAMLNRDEGYACFASLARRFPQTKGILINTFKELESKVLQAINQGMCLPDHPTPPIYAVGPLLALDENSLTPSNPCIEWLNKQPRASVVFLCFGSKGSFPEPQIKEIALGLERSQCRFLWSLRCRSEEGLGMVKDANLDEVLPEGFLDQTAERGLVWPSWVPQTAILAHPAVGSFVSHCGWNSCLESFWYGVPILAWPLAAEQKLNGFQLVKDLGSAVELRLDYKGGGLVSREEVERGVRCLMGECEERSMVSERAKEISEASHKAVEEGGSSFVAFKRLVQQLIQGTP
ncbi:UDP-glycosyltransferase 71K1-like [Tasmannia lanceolata]|uniref:UDP-glycosyltransferase 71K1-like n=1 Tax=Tasmannia lanceolata TaxID=3420 RepID=UPI00406377C1